MSLWYDLECNSEKRLKSPKLAQPAFEVVITAVVRDWTPLYVAATTIVPCTLTFENVGIFENCTQRLVCPMKSSILKSMNLGHSMGEIEVTVEVVAN
ncbi:hypothetical protein RRG08_027084 [Elysia crispata]|uniref:Uncharacterized protein n=1 Tax=Elysia crispata TaxID=231223 RepID=A0AAE0XZ09_9GAST|nr:hypothetical protein RRG08_027084 [Elysia crispata]